MIAALLVATLLLPTSGAPEKPCPVLTRNVTDAKFARGQVWSYAARPEEPTSTLTIVEIDSSEKLGVIIHVRVDGLRMHNPRGELLDAVGHMPFTREAILTSVIRLLRVDPKTQLPEGYMVWRSDCGGVYTISVAKAVKVAELTLNQP